MSPTRPAQRSPLARLAPFIRPILPRLILGLFSALAASLVVLLVPRVYQVLINSALRIHGDPMAIWFAAGVVLTLGTLEALFVALRRIFVVTPATTVEKHMRTLFYDRLQRLPLLVHDRWDSGQLLSRSMSDLSTIRRWMAFGSIMLVVTMLTVSVGILLMGTLSWLLTAMFLFISLPLIVIGFRFHRKYSHMSRKSQERTSDLATTVEESIHGIHILKAFGRSQEALENFNNQAQELRHIEISKARSLAFFSLASTLVPEVALGSILVGGILLVASGSMPVGGLVAFFATAAIVTGPLEAMGPLLAITLSASSSMNRYAEILDAPQVSASPTEPTVSTKDEQGMLVFDRAQFTFPDATQPLLSDITMSVHAGETLALVSATGGGKSTLLQLIPRLYEITSGHIRIDGTDIREYSLPSLRHMVSIAFEHTALFSTSIRDNLLLGLADEEKSPQELNQLIDEAIEIVQAHFIYSLPEGLDTRVGEGGLTLSGGQRQRLGLARAVIVQPKVLVLDDPLSALDMTTEHLVSTNLRQALTATTTIVAIHRPSSLAFADRVAFLHEGRIADIGHHKELRERHVKYREMLAQ